ncbi:DUF4355 domain-containing protein [Saxibacter everestensis]|uniref:DUF4355 domain-containing protein n=1 Tax=Saxibacter everestensis TaxID=2909229 RepID=A0ABY8QWV1_9MICO|nr:DUF4355 domain-containing protein [Brevibacteriaceae bacterium ZFBP1038]
MPEKGDDTATAGEHDDNQQPEKQEFNAPESQEELDRIIQKRIERERAKFSDYDDLAAKARKLEELEESKKTDEQRRDEERETLRKQLADLEEKLSLKDREVLKTRIASSKGVPVSALTGTTEDELLASADELLDWRGKQDRLPGYVPTAGTGNPNPQVSSLDSGRERARATQKQVS